MQVSCDCRGVSSAGDEAKIYTRGLHIVETRPATTYDNFARDFGERFVPGYKPVSTVDYLLNSPFKE